MADKKTSATTQPQRHLRLFAAHKAEVQWDGPGWFRTRQASARRLGTQVGKLATDCAVVLDADEKATLQAATALLARLGKDFEVAGREAKKYADQLARDRAQEKQREHDAIAARYIGTLDGAGLAEYAQDIQRFVQADESELTKVLGSLAPRHNHLTFSHAVGQLASAAAEGRPIENEAAARNAIVLWLESAISDFGHYPSIHGPTWNAWRAHRKRLRALVAAPGSDPDAEGHAD